MAVKHEFVAGDTESKFRYTCVDSDGDAIDLTNRLVELRWVDAGGVSQTRAMSVPNIVNAPAGVMEYQFEAGELFAPYMDFEVRLTNSVGRVLRNLELRRVIVRAALP